jgi:hypothetical protein
MAPRGKRCSRCLCCDAVIVFAGEALCAACDDDTHPALPERHNKFESDSANCPAPEEGEATPTGSIARAATSSKPFTPQPLKEEPMKVTAAMKQTIRDADPNESNVSIGKRLSLTDGHVSYYRCKMRNEAKNKKPAEPQAAHTKPATGAVRVGPGHTLANTIQATFLVTDKIMDNWWRGLKLGDKAAIFAANYVIRVEGTVE